MARSVEWLPQQLIDVMPNAGQLQVVAGTCTGAAGNTAIRCYGRVSVYLLTDHARPAHRLFREANVGLGIAWNGEGEFPALPIYPLQTPAWPWMWWDTAPWTPEWQPDYYGGAAEIWSYRADFRWDVTVSRGPFTADAAEIQATVEVTPSDTGLWVGCTGHMAVLVRQ